MSQILRTTADIVNPGYDRRSRYGERSIQGLRAGTLVLYHPAVQHIGHSVDIRGVNYCTNPGLLAAILANSEPSEPANYAEAMLAYSSHYASSSILEALFVMGKVTVADIDTAVAHIESRLASNPT